MRAPSYCVHGAITPCSLHILVLQSIQTVSVQREMGHLLHL